MSGSRRHGRVFRGGIAACLLGIVCSAAVTGAPASGLVGLDGRTVDPLGASEGVRATVVLFVRSDCPVSNRYAPEVRRIHERFSGRGVRFWLVYPDPGSDDDAIRRHVEAYAYPMAALKDPDHRLVQEVGATITPEAALFDAAGDLRYLGRIDDRYVAFGRSRPEPTRHDLADAIEAILDGRAVVPDRTRAIGCYIEDLR